MPNGVYLSSDVDVPAIGETTDLPVESPVSSGTVLSVLRGIWQEMQGFNERLAALTRAIVRPIWADPSTGVLRTSSVSGTITTVSTLSNQTQIGSVDARTAFVDKIMLTTWANTVRRNIS